MKKLMDKINKTVKFLKVDIWRLRLTDLPDKKALFIKIQRIIILTTRNFKDDNCGIRASALTFYTLLSFVPILAILFGIFKGFGLQGKLEQLIIENFEEYHEVLAQAIEYSNNLLVKTEGGLIAGIGLVLLIWSVLKLMNSIEETLTDIWKVQYQRSFIKKFSNYIAILFLAPLALIISSGATLFVKLKLESLAQHFELLSIISTIGTLLLQFLPYLVIWSFFTLLYIMMPNTKVKFRPALAAAIIAGSFYQMIQFLFVTFQVGVASYNAIYGSFAVIPLFLLWIQISWIIFLFGAEISYALQNISNYEFEADSKNISIAQKNKISLAIAHLVVNKFKIGSPPLTSTEIAFQLGIPIQLTRSIISDFVKTNLFTRVISEDEDNYAFQPGKDINRFTIQYVLDNLNKNGSSEIPIHSTDELKTIEESLDGFSSVIKESQHNKKLIEI